VTRRTSSDVNRDGDGRVPLAAALLEHVGATRYVRGEHGKLPAIPAVQEAVFDWLRGRPAKLPRTPAAALAATMGDDSPVTGGDDPGYLRFASPDEDVLRTVEQELDAGALPEFMRVKLL
jgi:uncharacterized protein YbjT (DUF2867 family)